MPASEETAASGQNKRPREQTEQPKKRKRRNGPRPSGTPTAHGSYKSYYNRRLGGRSVAKDERFPLIVDTINKLEKERPALLDIGCNDGVFATFLASRFSFERVVGVDLDAELIQKATNALKPRSVAFKASASKYGAYRGSNKNFIPISCHVVQGPPPDEAAVIVEDKENDGAGDKGVAAAEKANTAGDGAIGGFPFNVSFRCEDFSADEEGRTAKEEEAYDVILCLSVTKWVHLYGGDEALMRLFKRIYSCLRPGGVLILEPQPRQSYKRARQKKINGVNKTFRELKIRPAQFEELLLGQEVGFERCEVLRKVSTQKGTMFNRPIFAFFKAKEQGSKCQEDEIDETNGDKRSRQPEKANSRKKIEKPIKCDGEPIGAGGESSVNATDETRVESDRNSHENRARDVQPADPKQSDVKGDDFEEANARNEGELQERSIQQADPENNEKT